ncbi:NUDIX domain-containing protein [Tepidamorphus sp. 3E244]|uniref:NUDIX hydrolase n=1 Tax=Tepidamorphus sp. 3E244 TaxID=3385498 RepID=UPI0038FC8749
MPLDPSFNESVPQGDNVSRKVCDHCGFVAYVNPKIVVGSVVRSGEKVLLCRRAIEPRKGFWTIPAGYLELAETPEAGAKREAREEACANLNISGLLAVYTIAHLSQVQIFYRATFAEPEIAAGEESLEVGLFGWDEIPWEDIAFPSVKWALDHERSVHLGKATAPFANPDGETGGLSE